jgi:hypothetical protein
MADLKLNDQGDFEVAKLTADPLIIPEQIIPGCDHILLESGDSLLLEDGESVLCLEYSEGENTIIPEQILGEEAYYDLVTERNTLTTRLRRALQTPLGNISIYALAEGGVDIVDDLYGNNIYKELSEGLTLNFISRVRNHTINAITRAGLRQNIDSVQVNVLDSHTVQIHVTYTNNNAPTIIPITF